MTHYYKVAEFSVEISDDLIRKSSDLGSGLEVFSAHRSPAEPDFRFQRGKKEAGSNRSKLLFAFADCAYPTHLWWLDSGDYECRFEHPGGRGRLAFRITDDWKEITLTEDTVEDSGYMLFNRLGALFNIALLHYDACVFHGVVMEYQGKGILVMAPAGTGKSTHTNMWEEREHALILNGDRCLCRCVDGIWYAYGMPWAGSSEKILNMKTQIHAIVMLERDTKNHTEKMSDFYAELYLLQRMFAPITRGNLQENAFRYAHDIAVKVPVLKLMCRPDYESVDILKNAILELDS